MSREQWLSEKFSHLLNEDDRIPTLSDIKEYLSTAPQNEIAETTQFLQMPVLFDCLNDSNVEQIDLACEVLSLCLSNLNLGESTNRYNVPLERALRHPHPQVKIMALRDIQRNITNDQLLINFCKHTPLLNMVIKCIGHEDLGVAKLACDIITTVGVSENSIKDLLSADVKKSLKEVMVINDIVRLRVFEVFVNIAKQSEEAHNLLEATGLLGQVLNDLDNNDVLLKMNIIELLSQLVITEHGYKYLENNGVMIKFCRQLKDSDDLLFVELCEPGILKFFGQLIHWKPTDITSKYVFVLNRLFANIDSDNFTIVSVSLDTLGHIAETNEGKIALNSTGDTILKLLPLIVEKLSKLPNEVKIRALNCVESFLQVSTNDTRVTNITRKWFTTMEQNSMDFIMRYAKNPLPDIRSAGLRILNALAMQSWGQEVINNSPGLIEFLLDRNIETIKECKEIKFEIVRKLSESEVLNNNLKLRLQAFVKEGPFYIQSIPEVAVEEMFE